MYISNESTSNVIPNSGDLIAYLTESNSKQTVLPSTGVQAILSYAVCTSTTREEFPTTIS